MKITALLLLLSLDVMAQEQFGLKDDLLGENLSTFKERHHRMVKGHDRPSPHCSDKNPGREPKHLLAEIGYTKLGLVNCELMFPFERYDGKRETVAGINTKLLVYHFVDDQLYRINAYVPSEAYGHLKKSLERKYSKPSSLTSENYQNGFGTTFSGEMVKWTNGDASVILYQYAGSFRSSALIYSLSSLEKGAEERLVSIEDDL